MHTPLTDQITLTQPDIHDIVPDFTFLLLFKTRRLERPIIQLRCELMSR